ncbi:hypothetical protein GN956_G22103 [Arapaima gigas]
MITTSLSPRDTNILQLGCPIHPLERVGSGQESRTDLCYITLPHLSCGCPPPGGLPPNGAANSGTAGVRSARRLLQTTRDPVRRNMRQKTYRTMLHYVPKALLLD